MEEAIRVAEKALGEVRYQRTEKEEASKIFRRSLFVVADLKPGDRLDKNNVRSIRPGHGLPPGRINEVLGRRVKTEVPRGTPVTWELLE